MEIRGYRIEPGEIEAVLRDDDGVTDSVAIVKGMAARNKTLVAYYVARMDKATDSLRKRLKEILPEYMMPGFFIQARQNPQ